MKLTKLQKAVLHQLGHQELTDEAKQELKNLTQSNYGAAAGFPGFTYHKDTDKFYNEHHDLIWEHLTNTCDTSPVELISQFNQQPKNHLEFTNILSWYALEEVARELTE